MWLYISRLNFWEVQTAVISKEMASLRFLLRASLRQDLLGFSNRRPNYTVTYETAADMQHYNFQPALEALIEIAKADLDNRRLKES